MYVKVKVKFDSLLPTVLNLPHFLVSVKPFLCECAKVTFKFLTTASTLEWGYSTFILSFFLLYPPNQGCQNIRKEYSAIFAADLIDSLYTLNAPLT
jgi:hypothetical protein